MDPGLPGNEKGAGSEEPAPQKGRVVPSSENHGPRKGKVCEARRRYRTITTPFHPTPPQQTGKSEAAPKPGGVWVVEALDAGDDTGMDSLSLDFWQEVLTENNELLFPRGPVLKEPTLVAASVTEFFTACLEGRGVPGGRRRQFE